MTLPVAHDTRPRATSQTTTLRCASDRIRCVAALAMSLHPSSSSGTPGAMDGLRSVVSVLLPAVTHPGGRHSDAPLMIIEWNGSPRYRQACGCASGSAVEQGGPLVQQL